jgi:hypothetical protein
MDLQPKTTEVSFADDRRWEASTHGDDCTRSITLDVPAFDAQGLVITDQAGVKRIASGTPVRKNGTQYVPVYTGTVVAGADNDTWAQNAACDGHLQETVFVRNTGAGSTAGAALRWHGVVVTAQVPRPLESSGKFDTDAPAFDATKGAKHILYV